MKPHLVAATVPGVEIAHDADAPRIWGPHGETRACHTVHDDGMRTHLRVAAQVATFRMKIEVQIAQHGAKSIGIVDQPICRTGRHVQPIGENIPIFGNDSDEQTCVMFAHKLGELLTGFAIDHRHLRGFGIENAHHNFARHRVLVHPQKRKRIIFICIQNRRDPRRTQRFRKCLIGPSHWHSFFWHDGRHRSFLASHSQNP